MSDRPEIPEERIAYVSIGRPFDQDGRPNIQATDRIGAESKHGQMVGYEPYVPLSLVAPLFKEIEELRAYGDGRDVLVGKAAVRIQELEAKGRETTKLLRAEEATREGTEDELKAAEKRVAEVREALRTVPRRLEEGQWRSAEQTVSEILESSEPGEALTPDLESEEGEAPAVKLEWTTRNARGGDVRILRCPTCGRWSVDWPDAVRGVACFAGHDSADWEVVKVVHGPAATAVWALFQAGQLATDGEWQGEIKAQGVSLLDAIDQRVDVALEDIAASTSTTEGGEQPC